MSEVPYLGWNLQGRTLNEQAAFAPATSGVYGLYNTTDCAFYVGSAKNIRQRLKEHLHELRIQKHSNFKLQNRWNATVEQTWQLVIFELCSLNIRFVREQHYIDSRFSHFEGYNRAPRAGSSATYQWNIEQRQRHSEIQKLRFQKNPLTLEQKQRLKILALGRKRSPSERHKISEKLKGRIFSSETLVKMRLGQLRRRRAACPVL